MSRKAAAVSMLLLLPGAAGCGGEGAQGATNGLAATLPAKGFGRLSFTAGDGKRLEARTYRSTGFRPADGPVWFVMHGIDRDVERYINAAAPVAERYDAMAIAIHFTTRAYPAEEQYPEVERAFDLVRASLGGRQPGYYLFGHSAGAQFTHRLLTFLPHPRVIAAVAANAGWYTLPTARDRRLHSMPYGLIGGPVQADSLAGLFGTRLVVLLGANDTTTAATDDLVRGTREAEAQGSTRLERGRHYVAVARKEAAARNLDFAWRLAIAPGVGHDAGQIMASAGYLMLAAKAEPCATSSPADAAGLAFTEILADPPAGSEGDANGDGIRDPDDDEFVEITNRGTAPVCLAGWTLGDATIPARHVFPLGPALQPGHSVIVFGGGVPTGTFGGAEVQWSARGLSLQNAGDVLSIRSPEGAVVRQFSWGDCGGAACARNHWPGTLGIGRSLEPLND